MRSIVVAIIVVSGCALDRGGVGSSRSAVDAGGGTLDSSIADASEDAGTNTDASLGDDAGASRDGGPEPLDAGPGDGGCMPEGATSCDDETYVICSGGVVTTIDCLATGGYCDVDSAGVSMCFPQICTPGALRCSTDLTQSLQCDRRGSTELPNPCTFGCDTGTGDCVPSPTCPLAGVTPLGAGRLDFNLCSFGSNHGNRRTPRTCRYNGSDGRERVFSLTLASRVTVTLDFRDDDSRRYIDTLLYIRSSCDAASSQIACVDDSPSVTRTQLTVTLDAGVYYVFADSWDSFGGECGEVRLDVTFR